MKIPFSVYDFFGYLAAGFLVLAGFDYAFFDAAHISNLGDSMGSGKGLFASLLAYITGHIVAHFAYDLFELRLVSRRLGKPERRLFQTCAEGKPCRPWRNIFPAYFIPLEASTREVVERTNLTPGRKLFNTCHSVAVRDSVAKERLDVFLSLYGFARNVSLACLLVAVFLVYRLVTHFSLDALIIFTASIFAAIVMLYRYLTFYRLFAVEVFRAYAYAKAAPAPEAGQKEGKKKKRI